MQGFLMCIVLIGEIATNKLQPSNNTLIENKSWFERQNSSWNDAVKNGGDVVLFEGGTWNVHTPCKNCDLQRYQTACQTKGEYLNLCGECVGGSSEKEDDYGVDSCSICSGLDSCGRTSCSDSPDDEFESDTNCTHEVTIRQKVIDIASSLIGQVHLVGNVEGEIFYCSIYKEAKKLGDGKMVEMELGTAIEFELPNKEGRLELRCNSSEDISFTQSLLVVDSRKLHPLSADVESIDYGIESTVAFTVGSMHALADLLCFARDESGNTVYKAWSNNVQGNQLSSQVVCERIWPKMPGRMKFGVVYSEEAIPLAKTLDVNVAAKPLTLLRTTLDKYRLTLTFDQTLAKYTDCNEVFKDITSQEAKCWSVGNQLRVAFKSTPKIGDRLTVKCASAADGRQDSFLAKVMRLQASEAMSNLEIDGPDTVCSGQIATFNVDGAGVTNWTISIPIDTSTRNSMTPGNQQRKNLMLWRGSREAGKALRDVKGSDNRATLNTSMLTAGNEYQMRATMLDSSGQTRTLKKNFRVVKGEVGQPLIKGPSRLSWTHDALFEMENPICNSENANIKLTWSLDDNGNTLVQREGSKMKLENGLLSSNAKYNVTLKMYNGSNVLSEIIKELEIEPTSLKTATYIQEIVFGTGHRIVLPSNPDITSSKAATVEYKWSCQSEHGTCLMPGKEMQPVESLGGFDRSILDLPAGSLPVGKYVFTLEAILPSGESTSNVIRVLIVPGEPTLLSLISIDYYNNLEIVLRARHIIEECELDLESLKTINSTFLDLKDAENPVRVKGTLHSPLSRTLNFEIQREKLIFGSSYVFRLMASCKGLSQSWLTFSVPLPEMSLNCKLDVSSRSGEAALATEFSFQAIDCLPTNPIYSFGFKTGEKTHFFTSTLEPAQSTFAFPGLWVPVMRLCEPDKLCSMAVGAEIEVKSSTVDRTAINSVLDLYEDNLKSGHFVEALGCSELLLMSSQDETLRKNLSDSLVGILLERIGDTEKSLANSDENVPNAVELLHCAMSIVKITEGSDEAISTVLEFRDVIEQASAKKDGDVEEISPIMKSKIKRSLKQKRGTSIDDAKKDLETGAKSLSTVKGRPQERNETIKFLAGIPSHIRKICPLLYGGEPFYFREGMVEVTIVRVSIQPNSKILKNNFPECLHEKCLNSSGKVVLTTSFLYGFSKKPNEICLGLNRYEEDLYSIAKNSTTEPNVARRSWIYASQLFNGSLITNDGVNDPPREPLGTVTIPIWNATIPKDSDLKCHMWKNDEGWDSNFCGPEKKVTISNMFPAIECKCPFPGVYAVFAVPKAHPNDVITGPVKVEPQQNQTAPPTTTKMVVSTTTAATTAAKTTTMATTVAGTSATTVKTQPTTLATTTVMTTTPAKPVNSNDSAALAPQMATTATTVAPTTVTTKKASTPIATTPDTSVSKPEAYRVSASFMINETYNVTVGSRKNEFEDNLKGQLTKLVKIPEDSKLETRADDGKIKVTLKLKVGKNTDLPLLSKLLESGELALTGLDNRPLKVPSQNLEVSLSLKEGGPSPLAIFSSALFIALAFIIAIFLAGMFMKWKRQQRALSFVQNMEVSAPKYLRLQETSSTDRLDRSFGSAENLRSGDLDSGIVLTVDPSRMSTKYRPGSSSSSRHTVA